MAPKTQLKYTHKRFENIKKKVRTLGKNSNTFYAQNEKEFKRN
jgi:hypothetical protein